MASPDKAAGDGSLTAEELDLRGMEAEAERQRSAEAQSAQEDPWRINGDPWGGSAQAARKRSRTPTGPRSTGDGVSLRGESAEGDEEHVTRGDLNGAIDQMQLDLQAAFMQVFTKNITHIDKKITDNHQKLEKDIKATNSRVDEVDKDQARVAADVGDLSKRIEALEARNRVLEDGLNVAQRAEPAPPPNRVVWDRQPDGSIFKLSAAAPVANAQVSRLFDEMLLHSKIPKGDDEPCFQMVTKAPFAKSFIFQFKGTPSIAGDNCERLWSAMRNKDGSWKEWNVPNPDGGQTRVYAGLDISPRKTAEERAAKHFAKFLQKQPEFSGKQVYYQRRDAAILVNWRLVARVSCASRDNHELLMLRDGMEAAGIVPAAILVHFKTALREAGIGEGASKLKWESCV